MASTRVHPYSQGDFSELQTCRQPYEFSIKTIAKALILPLTFLTAFGTFFCIIITTLWFLLKPQAPIFQLNSLSVCTINTTNSSLIASWDVNLTFMNRDPVWNANFRDIECTILFRYHYRLAAALLHPLRLGMMEEGEGHIKLVSEEEWAWGKAVLEEMREERRKGAVNLEMTMSSKIEFDAWWLWWGWSDTIRCSFLDLKLSFEDSAGSGTLITPVPKRYCMFL